MTDLWYIKRNVFLYFETLKCLEIVLKFTKNVVLKFHYFVLGPQKTHMSRTNQRRNGALVSSIDESEEILLLWALVLCSYSCTGYCVSDSFQF